MEEKKVIRMDEHKNKNKVHKLSGKKIFLGIVAVLVLTIAIIAGTVSYTHLTLPTIA